MTKRNLLFTVLISVTILFSHFTSHAQKRKRRKKAEKVIRVAKQYKGTKYKWGGTTKRGIDCSGLMCQAYKSVGVKLPRRSQDQSKYGKKRTISNVAPGDMVFFRFRKKGGGRWWHSGLITKVSKGKIMFIHASSSKGVIESNLFQNYYKKGIKGFRRVIK